MNKNIFKELKNIIYNTCLYFTGLTFLLLIAFTLMAEGDSIASAKDYLIGMTTSSHILLFCFIMSLLNLCFKIKYSMTIKVLLHFLLSLAAYAIVFVFMLGSNQTVENISVRLLLFTVVYFVIAFIALIVTSIRKNRKNANDEYTSQFEKNK